MKIYIILYICYAFGILSPCQTYIQKKIVAVWHRNFSRSRKLFGSGFLLQHHYLFICFSFFGFCVLELIYVVFSSLFCWNSFFASLFSHYNKDKFAWIPDCCHYILFSCSIFLFLERNHLIMGMFSSSVLEVIYVLVSLVVLWTSIKVILGFDLFLN